VPDFFIADYVDYLLDCAACCCCCCGTMLIILNGEELLITGIVIGLGKLYEELTMPDCLHTNK